MIAPGFLRDLVTRTRCRVLLTSRRDERAWLGDLPARVELPPMPMRDRLQLAGGIAPRHQVPAADVDWRPLLRYTAGNPLTIMVLVGLALRENLTTTPAIEDFVARLRAGETDLSAGQDESLGRTTSLSASLGYGFTHAFTDTERRQLAVLHLFRDTVTPTHLGRMGHPLELPDIAVPELSGLDEEAAVQLLEKAREIGLLTSPLMGGSYAIHPALPWYFSNLFSDCYPPPDDAQVSRAYAHAVAGWGEFLHHQYGQGHGQLAITLLDREEGNLRHALTIAQAGQQWTDALLCLQGLRTLYTHTGRDAEWARLVVQATTDFTDPATDGPLPGREEEWTYVTSYRVRLAREDRDWATATRLQNARVAWDEKRAEAALRHDELTDEDRDNLRNLGVSYEYLGKILKDQKSPDSLDHFQHALDLYKRIGGKIEAANIALDIGDVYLDTPGRRDLDQAQEWTQRSLDSRSPDDRAGQAACLSQLGDVASRRFRVCMDWAKRWGDDPATCLAHLNTALTCYLQALPLVPADNPQNLAVVHGRLGRAYSAIQQPQQALQHFQEALRYHLLRGDVYDAGLTRFDIAVTLRLYGNRAEAWQYARAALEVFQRGGQDAAQNAARARQLIAELEQRG